MSAVLNAFGLDQLSVAERILLVEALWASIAAELDAAVLTPAQQEDLRQRLDAHRDHPTSGAPWEEVWARLAGGRR